MPSWFPHNLAETVVFVPLRIAFLVLAAVVVRLVVHRLINRALVRATGTHHHTRVRLRTARALLDGSSPSTGRREARLLALGSLARSATTLVVTAIAVLMTFSEMGFNITSLVAGTSIVAVTVAFGLQNVIKDLVSGLFMLVEDQLGVGDYVDMEKASGTVEEIGLRVTQLRDDDGNVWYVRNGEIVRVGNFSQGGTGRPHPTEAQVTPIRLVESGPGATGNGTAGAGGLSAAPGPARSPATTAPPPAHPDGTSRRTHRPS